MTDVSDVLKGLPNLLDFPLTIFLVWIGFKVWREAKELVTRIDERQHLALRDLAEKTESALVRVTEGMASIREEVRVFRAEVYARIERESRSRCDRCMKRRASAVEASDQEVRQ